MVIHYIDAIESHVYSIKKQFNMQFEINRNCAYTYIRQAVHDSFAFFDCLFIFLDSDNALTWTLSSSIPPFSYLAYLILTPFTHAISKWEDGAETERKMDLLVGFWFVYVCIRCRLSLTKWISRRKKRRRDNTTWWFASCAKGIISVFTHEWKNANIKR